MFECLAILESTIYLVRVYNEGEGRGVQGRRNIVDLRGKCGMVGFVSL